MAQKIQVRRDTALNWEDVNPVLAVGEFGYEIDTKKVKIGDGLTAWLDLDYLSSGGSELTIDGYDIEENGEILRHTLDEFRSEKSNGDTFVITKDSASMVTMDTNGQLKKASEISSLGAGGQAINYDGNEDIDNVKAWSVTYAGVKLGEESPMGTKGLTATEQGIKGETKNHENVVTSFYDVDTNGLRTEGLQGNVEVTPSMIDIEDGQGKGVQIKHDRIILNDGVEPITLFKPPASGVMATHEWIDDHYTPISWNFKGALDTYADLLLVTGMAANDAYLVLEKDTDGVQYLYIYNGTIFPLEFKGLPYATISDPTTIVNTAFAEKEDFTTSYGKDLLHEVYTNGSPLAVGFNITPIKFDGIVKKISIDVQSASALQYHLMSYDSVTKAWGMKQTFNTNVIAGVNVIDVNIPCLENDLIGVTLQGLTIGVTQNVSGWHYGDSSTNPLNIDSYHSGYLSYTYEVESEGSKGYTIEDIKEILGNVEEFANVDDFVNKVDNKAVNPDVLINDVIGDWGIEKRVDEVFEYADLTRGSQDFSNSLWGIINTKLTNFPIVNKIRLNCSRTGVVNLNLFEIGNYTTPYLVIPLNVTSVGISEFNLNLDIDTQQYLICVGEGVKYYVSQNDGTFYIGSGALYMSTDVVPCLELMYSRKEVKKLLEYIDEKVKVDDTELTVSKEGVGFNTISEAVTYAKALNKDVVIKIRAGVYDETVDLITATNKISLVGDSPRQVTIIRNFSDYFFPPLNVSGDVYFEGINFKVTNTQGAGSIEAYAVHYDFVGAGVTEFFNCTFENETLQHTFGAGSHLNQTLKFRNCKFYQILNVVGAGALYWHNGVNNNQWAQRLEVLNCEVYSNYSFSLILHDANQTSNTGEGAASTVMFVGNTFYSNVLGISPSFERIETIRKPNALVGNIFLDPRSHGNNIAELNA